MRGRHDYDLACQCYRCKGIRNDPRHEVKIKPKRRQLGLRVKAATKAEQHARYLDCGPQNWDDWQGNGN